MRVPSILIVDDEECIRDFLDIALSDKGHITTACDGIEALDKLQKQQFDLIISDIQMPHLNGLDLYAKLHAIDPGVMDKFVFCTGYVTDTVHDFISTHQLKLCKKPIQLSAMNSIVNEILS